MLKEFRDFAMRGNVVDLAVGVIIGAAFTAIVTSLVNDVLMPPLGVLIGGVDFSNIYLPLAGQASNLTLAEAKKAGAVMAIGNFATIVINFVILAFVIFMLVRWVSALMPKAEPAPAAPP